MSKRHRLGTLHHSRRIFVGSAFCVRYLRFSSTVYQVAISLCDILFIAVNRCTSCDQRMGTTKDGQRINCGNVCIDGFARCPVEGHINPHWMDIIPPASAANVLQEIQRSEEQKKPTVGWDLQKEAKELLSIRASLSDERSHCSNLSRTMSSRTDKLLTLHKVAASQLKLLSVGTQKSSGCTCAGSRTKKSQHPRV